MANYEKVFDELMKAKSILDEANDLLGQEEDSLLKVEIVSCLEIAGGAGLMATTCSPRIMNSGLRIGISPQLYTSMVCVAASMVIADGIGRFMRKRAAIARLRSTVELAIQKIILKQTELSDIIMHDNAVLVEKIEIMRRLFDELTAVKESLETAWVHAA